jgi:hypothetical protein
MRIMKKSIWLLLILFTACVKEVDFKTKIDQRLVINCLFAPNQPIEVFVTKATNATDTLSYPIVEDAIVKITYNNITHQLNKFALSQKLGSFGYYTLQNFFLDTNDTTTTLNLSVQHSDLKNITATSKIPSKPMFTARFDLIQYEKGLKQGEFTFYNLVGNFFLDFNSFSLTAPYYAIKVGFIRSERRPNSTDSLFTQPASLNFDATSFYDPYITKAFILSKEELKRKGGEINTSIQQSLVFRDNLIWNRKLYLEVITLSEEYYQYINTNFKQRQALQDPFAEPLRVYNNIKEGYGIFAAYNFRRDTLIVL